MKDKEELISIVKQFYTSAFVHDYTSGNNKVTYKGRTIAEFKESEELGLLTTMLLNEALHYFNLSSNTVQLNNEYVNQIFQDIIDSGEVVFPLNYDLEAIYDQTNNWIVETDLGINGNELITLLLTKLYEDSKKIRHCKKCNAPRKTEFCFKCNTETILPAKGWSYPKIPDTKPLIDLAKSVGYNAIVHGSLERDVDILLVPWVEEAIDSYKVISLLIKELDLHQIGGIENKPHNRIATTLQFDSYTKYIDLSVMLTM